MVIPFETLTANVLFFTLYFIFSTSHDHIFELIIYHNYRKICHLRQTEGGGGTVHFKHIFK